MENTNSTNTYFLWILDTWFFHGKGIGVWGSTPWLIGSGWTICLAVAAEISQCPKQVGHAWSPRRAGWLGRWPWAMGHGQHHPYFLEGSPRVNIQKDVENRNGFATSNVYRRGNHPFLANLGMVYGIRFTTWSTPYRRVFRCFWAWMGKWMKMSAHLATSAGPV